MFQDEYGLLCIGNDHKFVYRKTLDSEWIWPENRTGKVQAVTITKDGKIVCVGTDDHKLVYRDVIGSDWHHVNHTEGRAIKHRSINCYEHIWRQINNSAIAI